MTYPSDYSGAASNNSSENYESEPAVEGTPNTNPVTGNIAETTPTVLLYMKDGTTYAASDYWVADGKLHFYVNYTGESAVDMSQVDVQRTVDENAKRGVRFTLKPNPSRSAPGADTTSAPATGTAPATTPVTSPAPSTTPAGQTSAQLQTAS